mgnify:CR=1 FL=1
MRKSTLALGLVLGCFAFGISGLAMAAEHPGEHPGEHPKEHKEACSACKTEVKQGELVCEDCGAALKEGQDGKEHCEHCKADKKGVCKSCHEEKQKNKK